VALAIQGLPRSACASADPRETPGLASSTPTAQPIESIRSNFDLTRTRLTTSAIGPFPLVQGSAAAIPRARPSSYASAAPVKSLSRARKTFVRNSHAITRLPRWEKRLEAQTVHAHPSGGLEILDGGIPDAACEVAGRLAGWLPIGLGSTNALTRHCAGFPRGSFTRLAMLLRVYGVLLLS
jgi:hypothetical protein